MMRVKFVVPSTVAFIGYLLYMIGIDVFVHDETFYEAWKGSPVQFWRSLSDLCVLAWQYKWATIVVFATAMVIVYIRRVPEIKNL